MAGQRDRPQVGVSTAATTSQCVAVARRVLEEAGCAVLVYPTTGGGGRALETAVTEGLLVGVLDLSLAELADERVGGIHAAGRDRLTAAALHGVPQVVSLGGLDQVRFGPLDTVPDRFRGRRLHVTGDLTLMRTTPEENDALGKEVAFKTSAARGPTALLLPLHGVSALDQAGAPFWWPEADAALFQSLRNWMSPDVRLIERDRHLEDPEFAAEAAALLLGMLAESWDR